MRKKLTVNTFSHAAIRYHAKLRGLALYQVKLIEDFVALPTATKFALVTFVSLSLWALIVFIYYKFFWDDSDIDLETPFDIYEATPNTRLDEEPQHSNNAPQADYSPVYNSLSDLKHLSKLIYKTPSSKDIKQKNKLILKLAENAERHLKNIEIIYTDYLQSYTYSPNFIQFKPLIENIIYRWQHILKNPNLNFTFHLDKNLPGYLFLDSNAFKLILDNLIDNGCQQAKRGRLHLHITGQNLNAHNWNLKFIIANTGRGYPDNISDMITQHKPVQQYDKITSNLAATYHMAKQIDAEMNIITHEGRGAEITIDFPVQSSALMKDTSDVSQIISPLPKNNLMKGLNILIIEDDPSSQDVLKTCLENSGCHIDCILDGSKAMEALARKPYDLVFMDVQMPELNGIKTTKLVRNSNTDFKDIPIIIVTADLNPDTHSACMAAGVDFIMNKPVKTQGLIEAVEYVMILDADAPAFAKN